MNRFSILHGLGQLQRLPHRKRFERALDDPDKAQAERLATVIERSKDTEFGKAHRLHEVRTLRDLQERVPVQNWDSVRPWVEREMRGERHTLCGERPVHYAQSSGTTGTPKRVPSTESFRREFQLSLLTSMSYTYERHRSAFDGSVLYYVAKKEIARAEDGTPIGYTSGFNFARMPKLVQRAYAVPYEVFEVDDSLARCYLAAWFCARSPVTVIGAIFPLTVLEFLRTVQGEADALERDLRLGTLRDDLALTPAQRAHFERLASRDFAAADRIARSKREHGTLSGAAIFPATRLLYCWTSSSAGMYVERLRGELGADVAVADAVYAANEGWCNVPMADGSLGGPVSILGHFYEFVEAGAWERGERAGVGASGLEPGKTYRVLLSTSAGLFRYDLGDLVTCTGFAGNTPCIHFAGRAGASYNLAGEKLTELHVQQAVSATSRALRRTPDFFVALPKTAGKPRWEILLEFAEPPPPEALRTWRDMLERELGNACSDYGDRVGGVLGRLALRIVPSGSYHRYRLEQERRGALTAQSKVLHLVADPAAFTAMNAELVEDGGTAGE